MAYYPTKACDTTGYKPHMYMYLKCINKLEIEFSRVLSVQWIR